MKTLLIYNLFPRLYKNIGEWEKELDRIIDMGFNSIYLNPLQYPGFSGSMYAIKDYYKYNPIFFKTEDHEDEIKKFLNVCKKKNLLVFMDLVIDHTAIDSELIKDHKDWYVLGDDGDVKRPGAWENGQYITWGDLAAFNLEASSDRDSLWKYLLDMCIHSIKLGFNGFRCDAAYLIPNIFWTYLISNIKKDFNDVYFLAETLGCTPSRIQLISKTGFDYTFNSSKWWNYNEPWCLEQYNLTRLASNSISFPDSHDTVRLMEECGGNKNQFLQRVYFEAIFSKGFMITSGLEYGFRKKFDVVNTSYNDWEKTSLDYTNNIKKILEIKMALIPLYEESPVNVVDNSNWQNVFCFYKEWDHIRVLIILNKDTQDEQKVYIHNCETVLNDDKIRDYSPDNRIEGYIKEINIELKPGELKIFASEKHYKG